ncbi:hypothetical protein HN018_21960 (plasmid) [Lichenicola cladoniae]|uniref:Uncharacterized protein n=1 Tax=Lichenicola cladoniae TaxID=1484109 RepID=A0A6M8HXG7_9PROT|nr:hypothetical protein [Lichenicola cladoniae]NPD70091.1 hypothetical protein [Acetobacteraceae bacterium]QKE92895.1 hypothetical protein HN018_21960 [Lichenicola cladoniae]
MIDYKTDLETTLAGRYQAAHDQFADAAMHGDQVGMDQALEVISTLCEELQRDPSD